MKWIGQHIVDLIARFRGEVYLEDTVYVGKDDDTKIIPSDQPITPIEPVDIPTIDIPSIDIPGENPDTPDRKINEVELSKKIRKAFKNLYK